MEILSLAVAFIALVVSGLSARFAHRQAKAAEKTARIESDRHEHELKERAAAAKLATEANLSVAFAPREGNSATKFVIANRGAADATDVVMTYLDALDGNAPPLTERWQIPRTVPAGESRQANAFLHSQSSRHFTVELRWSDRAGGGRAVLEVGPR